MWNVYLKVRFPIGTCLAYTEITNKVNDRAKLGLKEDTYVRYVNRRKSYDTQLTGLKERISVLEKKLRKTTIKISDIKREKIKIKIGTPTPVERLLLFLLDGEKSSKQIHDCYHNYSYVLLKYCNLFERGPGVKRKGSASYTIRLTPEGKKVAEELKSRQAQVSGVRETSD